jgi:hypothetical protein
MTMSTQPTNEQPNILNTHKQYIVVLQGDDGRPAYYYIYAASPDRAKKLACQAEAAPLSAVLSVRLSDFEGARR